jgi:hypothetical protein
VLNSHDTDSTFKTSLNIFLRIFEANFPTNTEERVFGNNELVTKGIKTSCKQTRFLPKLPI